MVIKGRAHEKCINMYLIYSITRESIYPHLYTGFFIHKVWHKSSSIYNIASVVSPNIYTVIKYEAINNIRFGVICYFRSNTCSTHRDYYKCCCSLGLFWQVLNK